MQTAIGKLVTRNTTLTTINIMVDDVTRLLRPLMAEVLHGEFYRINTQRSTTTLSLCGTFADDETLSAARSTATWIVSSHHWAFKFTTFSSASQTDGGSPGRLG